MHVQSITRINNDEVNYIMKRLSLITGLVCLTGISTQASNNKLAEPQELKKLEKKLEVCSNDGKIINKRYIAKHKGKKYVACCKSCAFELLERLERK